MKTPARNSSGIVHVLVQSVEPRIFSDGDGKGAITTVSGTPSKSTSKL